MWQLKTWQLKMPQKILPHFFHHWKNTFMSDVKTIRESLSMPQERMAVYLGISRVMLSMVEIGNRTLPLHAIAKLEQLEAALKNLPIQPTANSLAELQQQAVEKRALLNRRSKDCRRQVQQAEIQMKWMQEQCENCIRSLRMVAYTLSQLGDSETDKLDRVNMELQEMETLKKMEQYGPGAQATLRLKINALAYEAEEALKLVF